MTSTLLSRLADAEPEEMLAALERLVGGGRITMSQASEVYTVSWREQMMRNARTALDNAIEWLVVAYLDGEGKSANADGVSRIAEAREHVKAAADAYEATARRAAVTRWRIERRAS